MTHLVQMRFEGGLVRVLGPFTPGKPTCIIARLDADRGTVWFTEVDDALLLDDVVDFDGDRMSDDGAPPQ